VSKPAKEQKIRTLKELEVDEEDKEQNYYAGGQSSGQMIQTPAKKSAGKEIVKSVFENARDQGALEVRDTPHEEKEKPSFVGTGYRLGGTSFAPTMPEPSPKKPAAQQELTMIITFWRQGFSIDDGPLRRFDDPANEQFLSEVRKGVIPKELEAQAKGKVINVNLVDKSHDDYVVTKPVLKPFSGQGQTLGSGNPSAAPVTTDQPKNVAPPRAPTIDESQPMTSIQIRLHDGTRLVSKFNTTNTIQDIRNFVQAAIKLPAGKTYQLQTTMPVKVLSDTSLTIAAAGLQNAVIVQKLL